MELIKYVEIHAHLEVFLHSSHLLAGPSSLCQTAALGLRCFISRTMPTVRWPTQVQCRRARSLVLQVCARVLSLSPSRCICDSVFVADRERDEQSCKNWSRLADLLRFLAACHCVLSCSLVSDSSKAKPSILGETPFLMSDAADHLQKLSEGSLERTGPLDISRAMLGPGRMAKQGALRWSMCISTQLVVCA